jgi:adenosylcobinamide kinase / adenosylcobinamide-phosphate guanylyltransferase
VAAASNWFPLSFRRNLALASKERRMQQIEGDRVILILGGVHSGKSRYAQQLAQLANRVTFVATAERRDDEEMLKKIERHRAERPSHWITIEEPLNLAHTVRSAGTDCDVLLIDCLTLFASNLLEAHGEDLVLAQPQIDDLCTALQSASCTVILVSNEVGSGVVPAYLLGRRFRDLVGEINQRIASVADSVLLMVAGLPLALKGSVREAQQ